MTREYREPAPAASISKLQARLAVSKIILSRFEAAALGTGEGVEVFAQISGERRSGFNPLLSAWMRKAELCSVKKLPICGRHFGIAHIKLARGTIQRVSDKRMFHRREVHSDLMRPAGVELDFEQCRSGKFGEFAPLRESFSHTANRIAMMLA